MSSAVDRLAVPAVRYALGRMTYVVGDVVDTLLAHVGELEPKTRAALIHDIGEAIEAGRVGMSMDARRWVELELRLRELAPTAVTP